MNNTPDVIIEQPALYRVTVEVTEKNKEDQIDGYLAAFGRVMNYSRGQAIKKAQRFGGKIKRVIHAFTTNRFETIVIAKDQLPEFILNELEGKEVFTDAEGLGENLYNGQSFDDILVTLKGQLNTDEQRTLELLSDLTGRAKYILVKVTK